MKRITPLPLPPQDQPSQSTIVGDFKSEAVSNLEPYIENCRHVSEILPVVLAQVEANAKKEAA